MKLFAVFSALSSTFLVANCAASNFESRPNNGMPSIAVEVVVNADDLSFWDVANRESPMIDYAPDQRGDGIEVGELAKDGGDKALITSLAQEIAQKEYGAIDSLLISHKDKLVYESYFLRGRINMTHPQVSATKAYTGLAIGRAIQLGYLSMADLNRPVVSFLEDLDHSRLAQGAETITLHQAMTMRSGLRISDAQLEALETSDADLTGHMQVQAYLESSAPVSSESQSFKYQGTDPVLVMQVLEAVVPGSAEDFIKTELFSKLGIKTYSWQTDISGLPRAGDRASLTSRAMLKLGMLVSNKGKWNADQLLPRAFVDKAIDRIFYTGDESVFGGGKDVSNQGYGYYWWSADLTHSNKSYFAASAQGGGGQFIILVDELDLIVVVTAHEGDVRTLQMTAEKILPAFAP